MSSVWLLSGRKLGHIGLYFIFSSIATGVRAFLRDSHEAPQEALFKYCAIFDDRAFHLDDSAFFGALGSSAASGSQRPPKSNKNCPVNNSVMERF